MERQVGLRPPRLSEERGCIKAGNKVFAGSSELKKILGDVLCALCGFAVTTRLRLGDASHRECQASSAKVGIHPGSETETGTEMGLGRFGVAEEVALLEIDTEAFKSLDLILGLDALGDHDRLAVTRKTRDRRHQIAFDGLVG